MQLKGHRLVSHREHISSFFLISQLSGFLLSTSEPLEVALEPPSRESEHSGGNVGSAASPEDSSVCTLKLGMEQGSRSEAHPAPNHGPRCRGRARQAAAPPAFTPTSSWLEGLQRALLPLLPPAHTLGLLPRGESWKLASSNEPTGWILEAEAAKLQIWTENLEQQQRIKQTCGVWR